MRKSFSKLKVCLGVIVIACLIILGLYTTVFEISDWEYEHYYYIEIYCDSDEHYNISVPLPLSTVLFVKQSDEQYLSQYLGNLMIEHGNCTFEVMEYKSAKYLQIQGKGQVSLSSSFADWDSCANPSLSEETTKECMMYSNTSNISLIVDSRVVRKTNEADHWDIYYSSLLSSNKEYPIPTKETWKSHIAENYSLKPNKGWYNYSIVEDLCWESTLIY